MSENHAANSGTEKIQIMDNSQPNTTFKGPFHCEWEWHLRNESGSCFAIFALASRVVAKKKGKIFWPSAATVALQFDFNKTTVHRGMRRLRELGFFEWQGVHDNGTNRYRVVSHKEWAQKHPGQCIVFQTQSESERSEAEEMEEIRPPSNPKATTGPAGKGQETAKLQEGTGTTSATAKKSEATALARDLTFLSDGQLAFDDKQRERLAEVLKEFTAAEITSAFQTWLEDQDLSDLKNVSFLPGKFVQIADSLANTKRVRLKAKAKEDAARDKRALEMQAEAAKEREESAARRKAEEEMEDPVFGNF